MVVMLEGFSLVSVIWDKYTFTLIGYALLYYNYRRDFT